MDNLTTVDFQKTWDIVQLASEDELRAAVFAIYVDTSIMLRIVGHIQKLRDAQAKASRSGEMEVDEDGDFWADHDEDCHGLIDTDEMREEFPQGFFWGCCDQVGTAPGCTKGHHYAIEGKRMKTTTDGGSVSDGIND